MRKKYLIICSAFIAVFLHFHLAVAEDEINSNVELELQEQVVEEVSVRKHADQILITLKSGVSFDIPAPSPTEMESFNQLSNDKKLIFHYKRVNFLTQIARVLHATKFAFGLGNLTGEKITFIKTSFNKALGKEVPQVPKELQNFSERSFSAVESTLLAIDKRLWEQSQLFVSSNEFGVTASLSLTAMAGTGNKGFGGAQELGVSFVFNRDRKAFIFEIFHTSEAFKSSFTTVAMLTASLKTGPTMSYRDVGPEQFTLKGVVYGPPAVPGYINIGQKSFSSGGMLTMGLPPTPFADMMEFQTKFERNSLLRISVSPVVPGFVRFEFGNVAGSVRLLYSPLVNVFELLKNKLIELRSPSNRAVVLCGKAFAN